MLTDGETLEERLLDAGANEWPVRAEVHLYEATPGTQLGHLASAEGVHASEFEELSPQVASTLIGRAGLGHRAAAGAAGRASATAGVRRPVPGQRMYRVAVPGLRMGRRQTSVSVRVALHETQPAIRIHVRFSEARAMKVAEALQRGGVTSVVGMMRRRFGDACRAALATVLRHKLGAAVPPERATALATGLSEAIVTTLASELPKATAAVGAAVRDPKRGVTFTYVFTFANRQAITAGTVPTPSMLIRSGWHRD